MGNIHILSGTLLLSLLLFFQLDYSFHRIYSDPRWHVNVTSTVTNISLSVWGVCHEVTYCGVDSRAHLLSDFDVRAVPIPFTLNPQSPPSRTFQSINSISTPSQLYSRVVKQQQFQKQQHSSETTTSNNNSYSSAHLNWARILLLRETLRQCRHTAKWIVYTDTDAYISSRRTLSSRLNKLSRKTLLAFQNGHWLLNSGVQVWRVSDNGKNKPTRITSLTSQQTDVTSEKMLDEWEKKFVPSDDFFAEQNALYSVYRRHRWRAQHFPNGYLGWHIKGNIPYKVDLSSIARRFSTRTGPALFLTTLITLLFMFFICSIRLSDAIVSRKQFHIIFTPLALVQQAYLWIYTRLTSRLACTAFILIVLTLMFMLMPTGRRRSPKEFSKWDYYHVLPHGRVMLKEHSRLWSDAVGHLQGKGMRWRFYRRQAQSKWKIFALFTVAEIIEWSGLLWIYPLIVLFRWARLHHVHHQRQRQLQLPLQKQ